MSLRFRTQLQVDMMPDEQVDNRWEVVMPKMRLESKTLWGLGYPYYPIVESIHFAPLGFKNSTNIRAITTYYNIPIDKEDAKEANITFYCDTGMLVQYYIQAWKDLIFNQEHEFYYYPWQYKRDIYVLFYGYGGTIPTAKYILKGCYPITQSDFELQYSRDPKRLRITQKFNVDRVITDTKTMTKSLLSTFVSGNPLGIVSDTVVAEAQDQIYNGGEFFGFNNGGKLANAQDSSFGENENNGMFVW